MLFVSLWRGGFLVRFGRFGFREAMASKSRRTEVPRNPTGGGISCSASLISAPSILLDSAGLSCDADAWTTCARETSIGGCAFAVSSSKNRHPRLTSRLLLKGPRIFAPYDSGSARCGRVGGCCSCFGARDVLEQDNLDVSSAVNSGEYTGGREHLRGGMRGTGSGAGGSLKRDWRRLDSCTVHR